MNCGLLMKSCVNPNHTHQLQTHTEFFLLWGFQDCVAAVYTEIRCNCEPRSTAGTVDHMKRVASPVDTTRGCASRWKLDCCSCCAAQAEQLKTFTGEIISATVSWHIKTNVVTHPKHLINAFKPSYCVSKLADATKMKSWFVIVWTELVKTFICFITWQPWKIIQISVLFNSFVDTDCSLYYTRTLVLSSRMLF